MVDKVIAYKVGDTGTVVLPSDMSSTNTVICLGAGAGGCAGTSFSGGQSAGGGGSGAIHIATNVTLTASQSVQIGVGGKGTGGSFGSTDTDARGGAGGNTWLNGTSLSDGVVGAQGGQQGATSRASAGGSTFGSAGGTKTNGSAGGTTAAGATQGDGSGGGAPGPSGAGSNGSVGTAAGDGAAGGAANGGSPAGGIAGVTGTVNGGAGTSAAVWTVTDGAYAGQTFGPGSGGGSARQYTGAGGAGGGYGAGGGGGYKGSGKGGGDGTDGLIIIIYTPAVVSSGTTVRRGGMGLGLGLGFSHGGSSGGATGSAPTNSVAPTIGNATIGEAMSVTSNGTWTGSPTSYTYDWKVDGVSQGATYTPVEADRTKSITCSVTATNASGSASAASAGKTCRRTAPTLAYNMGALTRTGMGQVSLTSSTLGLLGTGVTAPNTWTCGTASTGTDAHWTKTALKTPKPAQDGVADATYVFTLTANWTTGSVQETQTLTITTVANTVTISDVDASLPTKLNTYASGKTVEIAVGSASGSDLDLSDVRHAANTVYQYADTSRPNNFLHVFLQGTIYAHVIGFRIRGVNPYLYMDQGTGGVDNSNLTIDDMSISETGATVTDNGNAMPRISGDNVIFNDLVIDTVYGGLSFANEPATNFTFNRMTVRHWANNAVIIGGTAVNAQSVTFNDCIFIAPTRKPGDAIHIDGIQIGDTSENTTITINRLTIIQAEGDAVTQGVFGGGAATSLKCNVQINGLLVATRANTAVALSEGNNVTWTHISAWKMDGPNVAAPVTGVDDTYGEVGPAVNGAGTAWTGTNTISQSLVFGQISAANMTVASTATAFGGTRSSPPSSSGYFATAPHTVLNAYTDAQWRAMTPAQAKAAVIAAMTPTLNGSAKNVDGTYRGALKPDGSWNDGAVYPTIATDVS
jgi:hypothetical protein